MLEVLDAEAARRFCGVGLESLGRAREEIDALNVFPVPDGDTGTNMFLTLEAAVRAVDLEPRDADTRTIGKAVVRGAFLGARGNSGVILSQLARGAVEVLAGARRADGRALAKALTRGAELGYQAVDRPVEGTILTVARVAGQAASQAAGASGSPLGAVARAAADSAREALARTPDQLDVLRRAGVVDAGARGYCVLLDALASVVAGVEPPAGPVARARPAVEATTFGGPAFEVMYLLDAPERRLPALRARLSDLGESLVVVGSDKRWNVHVHVDDVGAAIEAGVAAGRPHRIQVTHLERAAGLRRESPRAGRAVVAIAEGEGLAALFAEAGAAVVRGGAGRRPSTADLIAAARGTGAAELVLLPNDPDSISVTEAAAERVRSEGVRVAVIPTKAAVQALAALAVHEPGRRFDDDVVRMTSAAGHTRAGALGVANRESLTGVGVCHAGDVLGILDGDVVLVGPDQGSVAVELAERMLAGGGELVTLVTGAGARSGLADQLVGRLRASRPDVDTLVYDGGQEHYPLLLGVE